MKNESLNLCFEGNVMPDAEFPHPEGALLAKLLKAELEKRGWQPAAIRNWKHSGWEIVCLTNGSKVSLSFIKMEGDLWFLQITPSKLPGLLARTLLGKENSCSPAEVHKLGVEVDQIVKSYHGLEKFLWEWDAPPDEKTSGDHPPQPQ